MDRELVFAFLIADLCGYAVMVGGWWPTRPSSVAGALAAERQTWRRIWLPFLPAALLFALLCGWALDEPASAEPVPYALMIMALPFMTIFLRAIWRTTRALAVSHEHLTIATVGLLRPTIIVSPRFSAAVDNDAMAAALEHERAHARHRDPLRLWFAQLATELMWPAPAAVSRLQAWKRSLEIARDEEARSLGAAGPDLAAAILASLRLTQGITGSVAVAASLADDLFIKERISRLLQPAQSETLPARNLGRWLLVLSIVLPLAIFVGVKFGERLIGTLLMDA